MNGSQDFPSWRRLQRRRRKTNRVTIGSHLRNNRHEFLEPRLMLAVDFRDMLLADTATDSILRFDGETGASLGQFVSSGSGGLVDPHNPTFGPDGNLYVFSTQTGAQKVLEYDGVTGAFAGVFVDTGVGGFAGGSAMAFGPNGDLYVATGGANVLRYDGDTGAFVGIAANGYGITRASGVEFGPDGNLYVLDADAYVGTAYDRILRFDADTAAFIDVFVQPGSLEDSASFAFGPDGHVYVPDVNLKQTRQFNGTTGQLQRIFEIGDAPVSSFVFDLVWGPDGNAYAPTAERILRYDGETGEYQNTFVEGSGGSIVFFPPEGLAADLAVTIDSVPANVFIGDNLSVTYTVRNSSANATPVDEWEDVVYLSHDDILDPFDIEFGRIVHAGASGANAEYTETLSLAAPDILPNDYHILVVADRRGQVLDTNRASNIAITAGTVGLLPEAESVNLAHTLAVGRTLSSWTTDGLVGNELTITYTVYNLTADYVSDVALTATLEAGVVYQSASVAPVQNGQQLSWDAGLLSPQGSFSVDVVVAFPGAVPLQLDQGASSTGTVNFVTTVADSANPAILRSDAIDPALLGTTDEVNVDDYYLRAKAAELNQDVDEIFAFMSGGIGYESYVGSLRGARGTLWSGAGNSLDRASLLVALLRISGVEAGYAGGTLSDPLAQELIASMFPDPLRIYGWVAPVVQVSDPMNDWELLAEARSHFWVQFDAGAGLQDADSAFKGASIGQSFAAVETTFAEVPEAMQHQVNVKLIRELTLPGVGLLTGGAALQTLATVLDVTFSAAESAGKSVSLSHLVTSSGIQLGFTSVAHNYTPILMLNEKDGNIDEAALLQGTSYQELLTSFPFGTQVLTGLFLEVTLLSPEVGGVRDAVTFEKTLFDRIGYVARQNGETAPQAIVLDGGPAFTELDVVTLEISAAGQVRAPLAAQEANLARFADRYDRLVALKAEHGPADVTNEVLSIAQYFSWEASSFIGGSFVSQADELADDLAGRLLVRSFHSSPRVLVVQRGLNVDYATNEATTFESFDILSNRTRAIAYPDQATHVTSSFQFIKGVVVDSYLEQELFSDNVASIGSLDLVLQALDLPDAALKSLTGGNLSELELLEISAEAKVRIAQAVLAGNQVLVPTKSVIIAGASRIAWIEIDPTTGDAITVLDDGSHGVVDLGGENADRSKNMAGFVRSTTRFDSKFVGKQGLKPKKEFSQGYIVAADGVRKAALHTSDVTGEAVEGGVRGDPPVGNLLFSFRPSPEFATLGQGQPSGIAVAIVPDPVYTSPVGEVLLPTVFKAGIKNLTGARDRFTVAVQNVTPGFEGFPGVPGVVVGPNETGELSVILRATGTLPAVGTPIDFDVVVTSESNPAITTTEHHQFLMPSVPWATFSFDPSKVSTVPGVGVEWGLTIQSMGNVPANITFDVETSPDVTVTGLAPLVLNPGQTIVVPVTFTPQVGVPLNNARDILITPQFGQPMPKPILVTLQVAAPGADASAQASAAAEQLGNEPLALRLRDLSIALTGLTLNPDDAVFKQQSLASIDAVLLLMAEDAILRQFTTPLAQARDELNAAGTVAEVQAAVQAVGTALDDLSSTIVALSNSNFEVFLLPNTQVAQPGTPTQFGISLHNIGRATSTYNVSLGALPPGVTGSVSAPTVTLDRDEITTNLFVTITPPANEIVPFDFQVSVSVDGAPQIVKTVTGALTARDEFLSVIDVEPSALVVEPGDFLGVTARLLNVVNRTQSVLISYALVNSSGETVFTSIPIGYQLNVQSSLLTAALVDTQVGNLPNGQYSIVVRVTDNLGNLLPGGTGEGTVFIGSPVTATLTTTPDVTPPGTSTVTNTLRIDTTVFDTSSPIIVGHADVTGATDAVRHGNYLYATGSAGISIFDVSGNRIDDPELVRTVAGSSANIIRVHDDKLYTLRATPSNFVLSIYSLADPTNPTLLGATSPVPYSQATNMVFAGDHVYVVDFNVIFLLLDNDIFDHTGSVVSIDVSDPSNPTVDGDAVTASGTPAGRDGVNDGVLFNDFGTTNDGVKVTGGIDQSGGSHNTWDGVQLDATTMLVVGSTATGTDTQTGSAVVHVVDISDPQNTFVVRDLFIPGAVQAFSITVEGDRAMVVGSTGGFRDFATSDNSGFTGTVFLAALDVSDHRNPTLLHMETTSLPSRGMTFHEPLGNGRFVLGQGETTATANDAQLVIVDASDPDQPIISSVVIPADTSRLTTRDGLIYAASPTGVTIYEPNDRSTVPITASVQIPNNTGVAVVPGSFNVPPTQIVPGVNFDTLVWEYELSSGDTSREFIWQSEITGMQPGSSRQVTLDTNIEYTLGASGPLALRGLVDTPGIGTSVARYGNLAYVSGTAGISILDVTNPDEPELLSSFIPGNLATGSAFNTLAVSGDRLIVASIYNFNNFQFSLSVYSLADPLNPVQLDNGNARFPYQLSELFVSGDTAYATAAVFLTVNNDPDILDQGGDFAAIGFANPNAYGPSDALFAPRVAGAGGFSFINGGDLAAPGVALLASTTAQGGDTQTGVGRVLVVDVSDPGNLSQTGFLDIPDTVVLHDISVQGSRALVVGGTGGFADPATTAAYGYTGQLTLTMLDLANPQVPQLLGTTVVTDAMFPRGLTAQILASDITVISLGGDRYALNAATLNGDNVILIVDAADPANLQVESTETTDIIGGLAYDGTYLYATSAAGLGVYDFSGTGLQRQLELPPQSVASRQVLSLDPTARYGLPGQMQQYTLTIENPTSLPVTYDLAVEGIPDAWVGLAPSVDVPAGSSVQVALQITPDAFAAVADYNFFVTATTGGVTSSVQGLLDIFSTNPPLVDPESHGVVLSLSPQSNTAGQGTAATYTARIINAGSTIDAFVLSVDGLPPEFNVSYEAFIDSLLPGAANYRDVAITITPPVGTIAGDYPITVTAYWAGDFNVASAAQGSLTVLDLGVDVDILQTSGPPDSVFQLMVTNTGQATETFDLSVAAPAALVANLQTASVTLAPGASQTVDLTVGGIDFAFPGTVTLVGVARSRTNGAVFDSDSADVAVAGLLDMTAAFEDDTIELPAPGPGTFLLLVDNIGNLQDQYSVEIVGTTGPVTANLRGLTGEPVSSIPLFILPGLSTGLVVLDSRLNGVGSGTVTLLVRSLTDNNIVAQTTATISAQSTVEATSTSVSTIAGTTYGDLFTFEAIVSAGTGTPDGFVQFQIDGNNVGAPVALSGGTASFTTAATLPVDQYTITATYAGSAAFSGSQGATLLDVAPAVLTVSAANKTKVYGADLPVLTVSYSGFVNGDAPDDLSTLPDITTTATSSSGVGNYPITASGVVAANYTVNYVAGNLEVTQAALTITADDKVKVQNAPLPPLTASYAGLVNGDTPASLDTPPTLSTSATSTSPPGDYAIVVSNAADANYSITFVNGNLHVNPAPTVGVDVRLTSTSSPSSVTAGKTTYVTYSFTVKNVGSMDASNLKIDLTGLLPPCVTVKSIKPPSKTSFSGSATDGTWTISSLRKSKSVTLCVTLTVGSGADPGINVIQLTATAASANQPLINPENDSTTQSTSIAVAADLAICRHTATSSISRGGTITYRVTITNKGHGPALNVRLTDTLPKGTTFVLQTQDCGPTFNLSDTDSTVTNTIDRLECGETATFTILAHVDNSVKKGQKLVNKVCVTSDSPDPVSSNNSSTATTKVTSTTRPRCQNPGTYAYAHKDVDANRSIEPNDALLLHDRIERFGIGPVTPDLVGAPYFDVDGDDAITPADLLQVLDHINLTNDDLAAGYLSSLETSDMPPTSPNVSVVSTENRVVAPSLPVTASVAVGLHLADSARQAANKTGDRLAPVSVAEVPRSAPTIARRDAAVRDLIFRNATEEDWLEDRMVGPIDRFADLFDPADPDILAWLP